jgi:hypothetical protein
MAVGAGSVWLLRMRADDVMRCSPGVALETGEVAMRIVGAGESFQLRSWDANGIVRASGGELRVSP